MNSVDLNYPTPKMIHELSFWVFTKLFRRSNTGSSIIQARPEKSFLAAASRPPAEGQIFRKTSAGMEWASYLSESSSRAQHRYVSFLL